MRELETFVKTVGDGLRTLAQGVHAIADKLDGFVDSQGDDKYEPEFEPAADHNIHVKTTEETSAKADSPEEPKFNATAMIYEKIRNSKDPIAMDDLIEGTGFEKKKLNNILYRLKNQGKIKSVSKGVYAKV